MDGRVRALVAMLPLLFPGCTDPDDQRPPAVGGTDRRGLVVHVDQEGGTKHGEARIVDAAGRIRKCGRYDHDRKTGTWLAFDADGDTLAVAVHRNGLLHGESRIHAPNGTLLRRITYADGRMHGPYESHYPDGGLHERVAYRGGLRDGPYLRMTRTDTADNGPRLEGQYSAGSRTGVWRRYYGNGVQSEEGPLVEDRFHGRWTYWDRQGKPRLARDYVGGVLVWEGAPR